MSTKEYPITESKQFPTGEQIVKRIEETHLKKQITKMNSQTKTRANHPLYPILTPEDKSPIRSRVRNCDYHRLPQEVQSAIRSINRGAFGKLRCIHVTQYSTGVYDIRLNDDSSIIINRDAGKKTRRRKNKNKKNKSRRFR
jgi:hypothetical protein